MIPEIRITLRFTFHASRIKRGQVILRHTELTAYRCFLPDLAGFTGFCRTGPSPYLSLEVRSQGDCQEETTLPPYASRLTSSFGGEGGIRTHGPIAGTHAFQACRFDHSRTSPHRFSRGGILTRGLMTGKVTASAHLRGINPGLPSYTAKKARGGVAMRTLIGLGILVVLLVTAIILSASTFSPFSNSSRFFRRLSVAESPPNTPISHTREEQFPRMTCLPTMHLQRHLMKWDYHCQRHQPCLLPATIVPHAMFASLASVMSLVIMLATP